MRSTSFAQKYGPWAVVTGASSGIGLEFARQLAALGLNVALVARRRARLEDLSKDTKAKYPSIETRVIVADLSQKEAISTINEQTKNLDIGLLVNNAGVEIFGSFFKSEMDKHENCIAVNVSACVALTHLYGPRLMKRRKGGIIFVSSMLKSPMPYFSTYSGTKGFLSNFSAIVGYELKEHGVDVMCLEPGAVRSEMNSRVEEQIDMGLSPMSAQKAVALTLAKFPKRVSFTPGLVNRILLAIGNMLPTSLFMNMMGSQMKKSMKLAAV